MARIHPLTRDEAAEEARPAYDRNLATYGVVLNSTGLYAHRPTIQVGMAALSGGIARSGLLPDRLKVLVNLLVASLAGCPF